MTVEEKAYHKSCFKCSHGGCAITPSNYAALEGILYCKHHFSQLFKEKGSYNHLIKCASVKRTEAQPEQPAQPAADSSWSLPFQQWGLKARICLFLLKTTWLYVMPSSPNDTGLLYFGIPGCSSWITLVNHGTVIFNEIVVHPILKSGILPLLIDILLCCLAILYCSLVTYQRIIPCFRILFGWVNFASLKIGRKVTCFWRILSS